MCAFERSEKGMEFIMKKLRIPENHSGISKTLRLPEDIVDEIQKISDKKNLSFNKVVIEFLKFGLENFEDDNNSDE